jgi:hypothetical protein
MLPMLDFAPEAKTHWIESYNAIEGQLGSGGDFASIRDAASKAADSIARLAAVLHVFEYGARGPISAQSVEAARRIVLWHAYSARALLAPFTLSREAANAATLDRWLIDRCLSEGTDGFSTRTLLNGGPNGTRKVDDLAAALMVLAQHGRARVETIGKRRTVRVNPALLDGTADAMSEADAPDLMPAQPGSGWN